MSRYKTLVGLLVLCALLLPREVQADPDMLRVESLTMDPSAPRTGARVVITATFKNIAFEMAATTVIWRIERNGDALLSGVQPTLLAGASFSRTVIWTAVPGTHQFSARVEPHPLEIDADALLNNQKSVTITVPEVAVNVVPRPGSVSLPTVPTLPAYRPVLSVDPASGATSTSAITFGVDDRGFAVPAGRTCTFFAFPRPEGIITSWRPPPPWVVTLPGCSATTHLQPGTYTLGVSITYPNASTGASETVRSDLSGYVVVASPVIITAVTLVRREMDFKRAIEAGAERERITWVENHPDCGAGISYDFDPFAWPFDGHWMDASLSCFPSGGRVDIEALGNFELKNGWRVKEVVEIERDDDASLTEQPAPGSTKPHVKFHLWKNAFTTSRHFSLRIIIEGPQGTDPYR